MITFAKFCENIVTQPIFTIAKIVTLTSTIHHKLSSHLTLSKTYFKRGLLQLYRDVSVPQIQQKQNHATSLPIAKNITLSITEQHNLSFTI